MGTWHWRLQFPYSIICVPTLLLLLFVNAIRNVAELKKKKRSEKIRQNSYLADDNGSTTVNNKTQTKMYNFM